MPQQSYTMRDEVVADGDIIAQVHRAAFGDDDAIPVLLSDLRKLNGPLPNISKLACDENGAVVGHVLLSHAWLDADHACMDVYVLSPLGVLPEHQGQGVGKALIAAALSAARQQRAPLVFLEGNPKYYAGSGFVEAGPLGFRRPSLRIPEAAFQVFQLDDAAPTLNGTLVYRDAFWANDCVGLR